MEIRLFIFCGKLRGSPGPRWGANIPRRAYDHAEKQGNTRKTRQHVQNIYTRHTHQARQATHTEKYAIFPFNLEYPIDISI
jgi:hypothetical protein